MTRRPPTARRGLLALAASALAVSLGLAGLARAEGSPTPGGTVPSALMLSLSEPSPFRRVGRTRNGMNVYLAALRAEVTATEVPTRLSLGFEGTPLRTWHEPIASEPVKVRLREIVPDRAALRSQTVLVTLTAGGP